MASVNGATGLVNTLRAMANGSTQVRTGRTAFIASSAGQVVVEVGYECAYAIHVHENVEMKWRGLPRRPPAKGVYWGPAGQAKFLEAPSRKMAREGAIGRIILEVIRNGGSLRDGLLAAGLELQSLSQELVPIDTGVLKNSAYTVVKKG